DLVPGHDASLAIVELLPEIVARLSPDAPLARPPAGERPSLLVDCEGDEKGATRRIGDGELVRLLVELLRRVSHAEGDMLRRVLFGAKAGQDAERRGLGLDLLDRLL